MKDATLIFRYGVAILALIILLLVPADLALGETELEYVEQIKIKIKLKELAQAEALLENAMKAFPSSVMLCEMAVDLSKKSDDREKLVEAYRSLLEALEMKEVKDGSLDGRDEKRLKDCKKAIKKLMKIRNEVDGAVRKFIGSAKSACLDLVKQKKYLQASYILVRLKALCPEDKDIGEMNKKIASSGGKTITVPASSGGDEEKAAKLLVDAFKSLKAGKLDDAMISCKAALEKDPGNIVSHALLFDIAKKRDRSADMMFHGLTYLVFPLERQSVKRAAAIVSSLEKVSELLKNYFKATKKTGDIICRSAANALKAKSFDDVNYAINRFDQISHRTRRINSILKKVDKAALCTRNRLMVKKGCIVVDEKFTTPHNLWYQRDGYAFFEKGKFIVKTELTVPFVPRYSRDFKPTDFYVETEMKLQSSNKEGAAGGFVFRAQDNSNFYTFVISADGHFGVWVIVRGKRRSLTGKDKDSSPKLKCSLRSKSIRRGKKKNVIAVACVGDSIQCYVNGKLIFAGKDKTYASGTLGFIVLEGNHTYAFDNFKVHRATLP